MRRNDEQTGKEVGRDAMGRGREVGCTTDVCEAPVGSEDDERRERRLEGTVKEGEGFEIQHVDLTLLACGTRVSDQRLTSSMKSTPGTRSATP